MTPKAGERLTDCISNGQRREAYPCALRALRSAEALSAPSGPFGLSASSHSTYLDTPRLTLGVGLGAAAIAFAALFADACVEISALACLGGLAALAPDLRVEV